MRPRHVKTKFLCGAATTTTTLLTPIAKLSFCHGAQQLRQRCFTSGVSQPPLLCLCGQTSAGCLSSCNPVHPHQSRETRVEWRPTSASSWAKILDLLRNPCCSCWTALYLLILNRKQTVDPRTRGTDAARQDVELKFSAHKHWGTLSDCTFSGRSFGKTGFSRCVKVERCRTFPSVVDFSLSIKVMFVCSYQLELITHCQSACYHSNT